MTTRIQRLGGLLIEGFLVLVIGYLVCQLIRAHLCERYRIPSPSMAPTLHGHKVDGDLVLVDKTAFWFEGPKPFDTVVVRAEKASDHHIVKRLAVLGPAKVRLKRGDIWRVGAGTPKRVVKEPLAYRDLWIDLFRHPGNDPAAPCKQRLREMFQLPPMHAKLAADGVLQLQSAFPTVAALMPELRPSVRRGPDVGMAPAVPGFLATLGQGLDDSFLDPVGRRQWEGRSYRSDVGITLDLTVGRGVEALVLLYEFRDRDFTLLWRRDGTLAFYQDGVAYVGRGGKGFVELLQPHPQSQAQGRFAAGDRMRVTFGYQDGHFFCLRDDQRLVYLPHFLVDRRSLAIRRQNGLQVGALGKGSVTIDRVRVFRDIVAAPLPREEIFELGTGEMFLLGDNAHDSADSRSTLGAVSVERLVGRPVCILAPAARRRVFVR